MSIKFQDIENNKVFEYFHVYILFNRIAVRRAKTP